MVVFTLISMTVLCLHLYAFVLSYADLHVLCLIICTCEFMIVCVCLVTLRSTFTSMSECIHIHTIYILVYLHLWLELLYLAYVDLPLLCFGVHYTVYVTLYVRMLMMLFFMVMP